jgi:predicted ATPase with chaperone activity
MTLLQARSAQPERASDPSARPLDSVPPRRITVNLSPADLPEEGAHFDLPIALGLLGAMGAIPQKSGYVPS